MWRSVTGERPGGNSGAGARASPAPGPELAPVGLLSHDSPLLGLLSVVSRPAVSFLQRWSPYLSGRALKQDFVEQESDFLFGDVLPPPPQQLHSLPWFNLSELGIQSHEDLHTETVVSLIPPRGVSQTWLAGLWSSTEEERLKPASAAILFSKNQSAACFQERAERSTAARLPHLSPALIHCLAPNGEISALAPDLDHGYSSLEEEQLLAAKAQLRRTVPGTASTEEDAVDGEEDVPALTCDNKAIAFIMGCPCSDDSGEDNSSEDGSDDDDGFDSVCSSDVSDSDDEDEEDEFDSEAERLWSALCQNDDPYNPRNFTAKLASAPRPIPRPGAGPDQVQPSPSLSSSASSSSSVASSLSSSSSWDEASETETEQETLKLLGAFCSSDPYSPLNFQAPIRTKPGPGTKPGLDSKPDHKAGPNPEEQRVQKVLESSQSSSYSKRKEVRFVAEVQVFVVGCEERRGPWEELARDRVRFAKRCSEIEQVLSSCLQREHRRRVYQLLSQSEEERTGQLEPEQE